MNGSLLLAALGGALCWGQLIAGQADSALATAAPAPPPPGSLPAPPSPARPPAPAPHLKFAAASPDVETAVLARAKAILARQAPFGIEPVDPAVVTLGTPHAVYELNLEAVAAGGGLETSEDCGLRFVVSAAGRPMAAAEYRPDRAQGSVFSYDGDKTAQALSRLAVDETVRRGTYEVRFLRARVVGLRVLWLKAQTGPDDLIYILPNDPWPLIADLKYATLYPVQEFLRRLRPDLQERIAAREQAPAHETPPPAPTPAP